MLTRHPSPRMCLYPSDPSADGGRRNVPRTAGETQGSSANDEEATGAKVTGDGAATVAKATDNRTATGTEIAEDGMADSVDL